MVGMKGINEGYSGPMTRLRISKNHHDSKRHLPLIYSDRLCRTTPKVKYLRRFCAVILFSNLFTMCNFADAVEAWSSPERSHISMGSSHTCAIEVNNILRCWGSNATNAISIPKDLGQVESLGLGMNSTCVVTILKTVRCWGGWYDSDLPSERFQVPTDLGNVKKVAVGYQLNCALTETYTVRCWGGNISGVSEGLDSVGEARDLAVNFNHVCVIDANQRAHCWGDNQAKQNDVPADLETVQQISTNRYATCAVTTENLVRCWGNGSYAPPADLGKVKSIAVGLYSACAALSDSSVRCWGLNANNVLELPKDLGLVSEISASQENYCANTHEYSIVCWGNDLGSANTVVPKDMNPTVGFPGCTESALVTDIIKDSTELVVSWSSDYSSTGSSLEYSIDSGQTWTSTKLMNPLRVTNLQNDTDYGFLLRKVYKFCTTPSSILLQVKTSRDYPSAPTISFLQAVTGAVFLSAVPPVNLGDHSNLRYEYSLDGDGNWHPLLSQSNYFKVVNLTDQQTYQISVRAVNSLGAGSSSSPIQIMSGQIPSAPTNVQAERFGSGSVKVSWNPPDDASMNSITGYIVNVWQYGVPMNPTCLVAGLSAICSGLANGGLYKFFVRARNALGYSELALEDDLVGPATTPDAPTIQSIYPGKTQLSIQFAPPLFNGGAAVTAYEYSLDEGKTWKRLSSIPTQNSYLIANLEHGPTYSVSMRAINDVGIGSTSNVRYASTASAPLAPRNLRVSMGDEKAKLTWTAPIKRAGDSTIFGYSIRVEPGHGPCDTPSHKGNSWSAQCRNLWNGRSYSFSVAANSGAGQGPFSGPESGTPRHKGPPLYSGGAALTGKLKIHGRLVAVHGNWTSSLVNEFTYEWLSCNKTLFAENSNTKTCKAIPRSSKSFFNITSEFVNQHIAVRITAKNKYGVKTIVTETRQLVPTYSSCSELAMYSNYSHGVAQSAAKKTAWINKFFWFAPQVNSAIYNSNSKLDTNRNGVMCEESPHFAMPTYLSPSTVEDYLYATKVCHDKARNSAEQGWLFEPIDSSYAKFLYPTALSRNSYSGVYKWVSDTIDNPRGFDPIDLQKYQVQALNVFWDKAAQSSVLCRR